MPRIESQVKARYGVAYWETHKEEILARANSWGALDANVPVETEPLGFNARDRRRERRLQDREVVLGAIRGQVKSLRQSRGWSLDDVARSVGLKARSSLYHYRYGEIKPTWRLKVFLERLNAL